MIDIVLTDNSKVQLEASKVITKAIPFLKREFSFPQDGCEVWLCDIPPAHNGTTYGASGQEGSKYICQINVSAFRSKMRMVETLAHEFTHIEQMYKCKLRAEKFGLFWYDSVNDTFKVYQNDHSYEEYRNFPWEIEARARAKEFVEKHGLDIVLTPGIFSSIIKKLIKIFK